MNPAAIKTKISELARAHKETGDELEDHSFSESFEEQAEKLIIDYCVEKGYQVQGFPHEKKNSGNDDYDDEYFCHDRYRLYLDNLLIIHDDVADLMWHYFNNFWPDFYSSKEEYISDIKHNLETGLLYDVDF